MNMFSRYVFFIAKAPLYHPMNNATNAILEKQFTTVRRFFGWLKGWQNLTSALIALSAAGWAWHYTQQQIDIASGQLDAANKNAASAQQQLAIAAKQAEHAQRQLQILELAQRPILMVTTIGSPVFSAKRGAILWNWRIENVGKSSAKRARHEALMRAGQAIYGATADPPGVAQAVLIPTGQNTWGTAATTPEWDKTKFKRILSRDSGVELVIRVDYEDDFQNSYTDTFCYFVYASGAIGICDHTIDDLK